MMFAMASALLLWITMAEAHSCCFRFGYAAGMTPCCMQVNKGLTEEQCSAAKEHFVGGAMGWSSECPKTPAEAQKLKEMHDASASHPTHASRGPARAPGTGGAKPPGPSPRPPHRAPEAPQPPQPEPGTALCEQLPEGVEPAKPGQAAAAPFKSGTMMEVTCQVGWRPLNRSENTWKVKCVGWDAWSAKDHFAGCEVVRCDELSEDFGAWLGERDFNSTQRLRCTQGYIAIGAAELSCLASGLWDRLPGSCSPEGGNPELWRSKLRYSALLSFLGLTVTAGLVMLAWPKGEVLGRPPRDTE
ncbi:unnamed protein product [Effrenium voratum]|nr:unnamed protein product [Effrenium voratum]CAJ1425246.1 unnamed protein product [Effrenium voratum]